MMEIFVVWFGRWMCCCEYFRGSGRRFSRSRNGFAVVSKLCGGHFEESMDRSFAIRR